MTDLEPRIPLEHVATALGCSYRHALALVHCGALDAVDVRKPKAKRPCWSVSESSVKQFLEVRRRKPERTERAQRMRHTRVSAWARDVVEEDQ